MSHASGSIPTSLLGAGAEQVAQSKVGAVAHSLTVGISLVQPKARPISPRGRRLPQPGVCPDLVDAAGFTSRAISPPQALKLLAYSSGLSNSTWACIRRSSSCFA